MSARGIDAEHFERRYRADPDPWSYGSSAYESEKFDRTLAALPAGPIDAALELGCSNGTFTALLGERCRTLLASDFSAEAVRMAKRRTTGMAGVAVELRDLRDGLPRGRFDAIVCSELLYYWPQEEIGALCESIPSRLTFGGRLVAVHWRGKDPGAPLDGESVHGRLREGLAATLRHGLEERRPGYLLDAWDRPSP